VGKFLSLDPLTQRYPFYTPYQFAGNNPIKFVDVDGMEPGNSGGVQSDAPVLNPKYGNTNLIYHEDEKQNPSLKFSGGVWKMLKGAMAFPFQMLGAMHYGDKIPKDRFAQEFPALANNNIAKDLVFTNSNNATPISV
jgi:hypothetical protein